VELRRARDEDYDAVAAFTRDTWADRGGSDYVPRVYHDWIAGDPERRLTLVADASDEPDAEEGAVAAIAQVVLLSEWEAWLSGMRVAPDYRRRGLATRVTRACFDWARERGARVGRNWVHSWNATSLALSRTAGFDPGVETRWARPAPDPDAEPSPAIDGGVDADGDADPDAAWAFWTRSGARGALDGLAMDAAEAWAASTLTRERLHAAAEDDRLLTVVDGGIRGFALRNRTDAREDEDEDEDGAGATTAEYAVAAWAAGDSEAAAALLDAVARDAARAGAGETRVLVPEGPGWVSDVALAGAAPAEEPSFVMAADLTDPRTRGDDEPVA
jgi:GNAT superfamily N-acetyltransferase